MTTQEEKNEYLKNDYFKLNSTETTEKYDKYIELFLKNGGIK